jgi:hypothetical protein
VREPGWSVGVVSGLPTLVLRTASERAESWPGAIATDEHRV